MWNGTALHRHIGQKKVITKEKLSWKKKIRDLFLEKNQMKNPTKMSSAAMVQPIIKFFKAFSLKPKVVPSHADLFLILRCNSFLALHLLPSFPPCTSASVEERVAKYVNINFLRRYLSLLPYIYQCHLIIFKNLTF